MQTGLIFGNVVDSVDYTYSSNVTVEVSRLEADHRPIPMKPTRCTMEEPGFWSSDAYDAAHGVCVANEERAVTRFQLKTDDSGFFYKIFRFEPTRLGEALDAAEKEHLEINLFAIDSTRSHSQPGKTTAKMYTVIDWISSETSILPNVRKLNGSSEKLQPSCSAPKGKFFDDVKAHFMSQAAKPSNERLSFAGCGTIYL